MDSVGGGQRRNRSQPYQALLDELAKGPATRHQLIAKLGYLVPFERALREAERRRLAAGRGKKEYALGWRPPKKRSLLKSKDELVAIGRRMLIGKRIDDAKSNGTVVEDADGLLYLRGSEGAPSDAS